MGWTTRRRGDAKSTLAWRAVPEGFRAILPVTLYVVPMGLAFGAAAVGKGLSATQALFMSALVFAGSSQFAALDLWSAPLALLPLLLTTFAVNARHLLLGAALAPWLNRVRGPSRFGAAAFLSDPNWAFLTKAQAEGERDPSRLAGLLVGTGLALWSTWLVGTALGVILGGDLGDLKRFGLDLLVVAFFTAVLAGLWRTAGEDLAPWVAAAAVGILGSWLLPPGWHVLAGGLAGGLVGMLRHGR
jgi:4-azaleucine resistance transporter AzlC